VALFQGRRVSKAITATNSAEPIMDHMIGKLVVPILTGNSSGRPIARAIHSPKIAPTNPSAIETRQPPREKPVIACPSAPQIPATISKMRRSNNVMRQIITALSCCTPVVANGLHVGSFAPADQLNTVRTYAEEGRHLTTI